MIHSYLFLIRYLKFMLKRRTASAGFFSQSGTIKLGHNVKLMAPQFVKPYVKTNKNDQADAEGICEAVARPSMRFVPIKTIEQQDILFIVPLWEKNPALAVRRFNINFKYLIKKR